MILLVNFQPSSAPTRPFLLFPAPEKLGALCMKLQCAPLSAGSGLDPRWLTTTQGVTGRSVPKRQSTQWRGGRKDTGRSLARWIQQGHRPRQGSASRACLSLQHRKLCSSTENKLLRLPAREDLNFYTIQSDHRSTSGQEAFHLNQEHPAPTFQP